MIYQLDFGGRVTTKSAKNFQLELEGEQVCVCSELCVQGLCLRSSTCVCSGLTITNTTSWIG